MAIIASVAVAVGFAVKDYVSSLIAGIVAAYEKPYRIGDWVNIDDVYGEVKSLGLRMLTDITIRGKDALREIGASPAIIPPYL